MFPFLTRTLTSLSGVDNDVGSTCEQNVLDLARHARALDERSEFACAMLAPDGDDYLGCVYIRPLVLTLTTVPPWQARVYFWFSANQRAVDEADLARSRQELEGLLPQGKDCRITICTRSLTMRKSSSACSGLPRPTARASASRASTTSALPRNIDDKVTRPGHLRRWNKRFTGWACRASPCTFSATT